MHLLKLIPVLYDFRADGHDVYNATIWDDSPSGLGRWGDPANDYQINSGGFAKQIRVYPEPHHIRRNHSLFPFTNSVFGSATADLASYMANSTLTRENVAKMVNGFDGDFVGFQTYFDGLDVSCAPPGRLRTPTYPCVCQLGTSRRPSFDHGGVSIYHHASSLKLSRQRTLLVIWVVSVRSAPGLRTVTQDGNGLQTIRSSSSITRSEVFLLFLRDLYSPSAACFRVDGR